MAEERRLVTVLFADVTESTALGEELDPEDLSALMSRYYSLAKDIIDGHGGTVEKFIGDAVMAVFGLPKTHGDDAEQAVAAALVLRTAVGKEAVLARLRPHIGINTGAVMATVSSSGELRVTGDAVNTAARLEDGAKPEEILVGEGTHRAAPSFVYGPAIALKAKGKAQPIRAWPVLERGQPQIVRTPFLGRETDLEQLQLLARRAFGERRPQFVTVTAPAGTGKSRLLEEFQAGLRPGRRDLRVGKVHCLPYGESLTYRPMRAFLLDLLGLQEGATADLIREQVRVQLGDDHAERDASLIVMTVAPGKDPERRDRDLIFGAWRRLVEAIAGGRPLLVIFEDLQWAAESLLDLVEYLMQPRVEMALFVLATARPELLDGRPGWGGGRRNHTHIVLEPLDARYIGTLVVHLLGSEPSETVRRLLVERAEGNPFFAGELVRALRERGSVDLADESGLRQALVGLPETVHATVLARLDLLRPEEREVIQAGAVTGRTLRADVVCALVDLDRATVQAVFERLIEKDLLTPTGEDRYIFRHMIIREVAYQTLPRVRRARDHARVAAYLETTMGDRVDQFSDLISFHYLEATRLRRGLTVAPPSQDDEEIRRRALGWLSRAARIAAAAGASAEAAKQLRDGISLAAPAEELLLQEQLGEVFWHGEDALAAFERALVIWRDLRGDDATGARLIARYLIAVQRWWTVPPERRPGRERVDQLNDEALGLARRSNDERVRGMVLVARSFCAWASGVQSPELLARSRREAGEAADIFERLGDPQWLSAALDALSFVTLLSGDFEGAFAVATRRLPLIDRIPDVIERVDALCMVAWTAALVGRLDEGLRAARVAVSIPVAGRAIHIRLHALAFFATLAAMSGDWNDAVAAAREALATWSAGACAVVVRGMAAGLAVATRRGVDDLAGELRAVVDVSVPIPDEDPRAPVTYALIRAVAREDPALADGLLTMLERTTGAMLAAERALAMLAAHRRVAATAERLDELIRHSEEYRLPPITAHLLRLRSVARRGDVNDLRRGRDILRSLGMIPDAALATCELAALTRDRALLEEAKRDLAQISDRAGLRRVAEVEATLEQIPSGEPA